MLNNRSEIRYRRPSHLFIEAINFELTYQCSMNCSHCLQSGLRQTHSPEWIETDVAIKTIEDAYDASLIKTGLNFTGGDIFWFIRLKRTLLHEVP
jgi:MoaA/NifB/PqqE/SkfB family radical SAM enzyme